MLTDGRHPRALRASRFATQKIVILSSKVVSLFSSFMLMELSVLLGNGVCECLPKSRALLIEA